MPGKMTEEGKDLIRKRVLDGLTYKKIVEELEDECSIQVSKQTVSYYVRKFGLSKAIQKKKELQRQEEIREWRALAEEYMESLEDLSDLTLKEAQEYTQAPMDWLRDYLIERGYYDNTTFRERIDEILLLERYILDDMSLSELHEAYYNSVCISTLTQVLRKILLEYGLEPRPQSCAKKPLVQKSWRRDMIDRLLERGWEVQA